MSTSQLIPEGLEGITLFRETLEQTPLFLNVLQTNEIRTSYPWAFTF